jgi:hypothetical protein
LSLDAPATRNVTVNYTTAAGTAQSPSDFFAQSGAVTFNQGATSRVITINVVGDTTIESDETFVVNLTSAVGGTISDNQATVTIADDDALPGVSVAAATVGEGNQGTVDLVFTVSLSESSAKQVTVAYGTANSTATAGSDYEARSGVITFAAGETSKMITVPVLGDTIGEANERLFLNLSSPVNAAVSGGPGTGTIIDDDTLPAVTVTGVELAEGNAGSSSAIFTVNLSVATGQTVTLAYSTADGTANAGSDYTATSGILTFAPGTTSQTIVVPVLGDGTVEPAETFELNFSGITNATLSSPTAVATIQNDDTLSTHPWQNARNPLDVNDNGTVEALDVLVIINRLNSTTDPLPPQAPAVPPPFYDVDGNDNVTALDALVIINYLNAQSGLQAGNLIAQGLVEPQLMQTELYFAQAMSAESADAALLSDDIDHAASESPVNEAYGIADADDSLPYRRTVMHAEDELESILAELVA